MSGARQLVHNAKVTVRVNERIKMRTTKAARRQGMTLSEAIRQYLRALSEES